MKKIVPAVTKTIADLEAQPKKPFDPKFAPACVIKAACVLDADLDRFTSGVSRLPTTNNAVGFPVRSRQDPAAVVGHVYFSANPTAALCVSLSGRRTWTVQLNDLVEAMLAADTTYLKAAIDPKPAKKSKKAKKKGRR